MDSTSISSVPWGKTTKGQPVHLYTLKNTSGAYVEITNYGARIVSIVLKGKDGKPVDVCLGFSSLEGYEKDDAYLGAIAGRYANRIAKGHLEINGTEYQLAINNGPNHLHGGPGGFHQVVWTPEEIPTADGPALRLTYLSKDGEENYPGNLTAKVTYSFNSKSELRIQFEGTTDKKTVFNLTNHAYFNLKGEGNGNILDHLLTIYAANYTPVDSTSIPLGIIAPVKDTPFEFHTPTKIGARIDAENEQIKIGLGYDHNYVLSKQQENDLEVAAIVYEDSTGILMTVKTTQPGVQFYSANVLKTIGKNGKAYDRRSSFCLETQHFPDSPNHKNFPSTFLTPDSVYNHTCVYGFSVKDVTKEHVS